MVTKQEELWGSKFGDDYTKRDRNNFDCDVALFKEILRYVSLSSLIEFGANKGDCLKAIHHITPLTSLAAVEVNHTAATELGQWDSVDVYETPVSQFEVSRKWDVALTRGFLIHVAPDNLPEVYQKLYDASRRYICIIEYFSARPEELSYRGHSGQMFKRDFAGELLDKFPDLRVVRYGFAWSRDAKFPHNDLNWFLLEKVYR